MRRRSLLQPVLCLTLLAAGACSNPSTGYPPPGPTQGASAAMVSPTSSRAPREPSTPEATAGQPEAIVTSPALDYCLDRQPPEVLTVLKEALVAADGSLLASLVDPVHGMDVQLLRNGTIVNYDHDMPGTCSKRPTP